MFFKKLLKLPSNSIIEFSAIAYVPSKRCFRS
jgi:hypothetical protein